MLLGGQPAPSEDRKRHYQRETPTNERRRRKKEEGWAPCAMWGALRDIFVCLVLCAFGAPDGGWHEIFLPKVDCGRENTPLNAHPKFQV
jgi:hypothetical protein